MAKTSKKKIKAPINRRRFLRFLPDEGSLAVVDIRSRPDGPFRGDFSALVLEDSHGGCSFVCINAHKLKKGQSLSISIGGQFPLRGEIRWLRHPDSGLVVVGIQYLG
ncbi:MAG: hypothetical protein AB7F86_05820 [Bdellovibrionales bacterium]